ncbi:MAG: sulfatase family protein [Actinomycetia bacterium]|nr:sulfatase family protein [Actinomycetes bacterium]
MQQPFGGIIGDDWRTSTPWWPPEPAPPVGAPNVLLIVLDDVGFAQLGCYGSDIATPNIDRLATKGVRFANFHTTALCSPTRACLMTGRNHHRNGMGRVADLAVGFPGYSGRVPAENPFVSEALREHGYATYAVGKWHLTPEDETHMAAPRSSWPLGRGFDRWYGFHGGETHQFVPALFHDNHSVRPPRTVAAGYHLSEDLADRAIEFVSDLRNVDTDQRFFLYFATGACHSPHHAPAEWIEQYRGHFDLGWDRWRDEVFARQLETGVLPGGTRLSPRPPWVPAWDSLPEREQRVSARFMECFAGFLSHADAQIGRVLAYLEEIGDLDDTLVMLVSDNGASAEGGALGSINDVRMWNGIPAGRRELAARVDELGTPTAHNNYPWGWTMAGNTPFKRWKREVHEGGVADPCIVSWGERWRGGDVRRQFTHAIDVMPTILELTGVDPEAAGGDIDGTSFAYALDEPAAPERHETQYFEMLGSRAIYHRGWKAVTFKPLGAMYDDGLDPDAAFEDDEWELYHVAEDLSETNNLAAAEPERLRDLEHKWWEEARRNDVLPLDNRPLAALLNPRPTGRAERDRYVYYPNGAVVPETVAVNVRNRTHLITAEIDVAAGVVPEGVLIALGSVLGGWVLYAHEGRLRYVHNLAGRERNRVAADAVIPPGTRHVGMRFEKTAEFAGHATLLIDDEPVGDGDIPFFTPVRFSITGAGLSIGYEVGPPISDEYEVPFPWNAGLTRVVVEVAGTPHRDPEAEYQAIMSEQ